MQASERRCTTPALLNLIAAGSGDFQHFQGSLLMARRFVKCCFEQHPCQDNLITNVDGCWGQAAQGPQEITDPANA